jgi:rfaE bifunctional protein nucleotidyltransferase chain/domain
MTTVFTNGVFDLLHVGHVHLLQFARDQGDRLIVAINSDDSVRRLKGPSRPVIPAIERVSMLMAFRGVDEVVVFPEDTPARLIAELRPDVLVKGPECNGTVIPGADLVLGWGGRVVCPDWPVQHSTTRLVERIRRGDETLPWPQLQTLAIDNVEVTPSPRFSLTWVSAPDGPRPVLYDRGKRVTVPWSIQLVHDQPADPWGRSA